MARGSGVGVKGNKRRKIRQREEDSEESDEEYNVAEDEDSDESDECYSLDGDESEEISDDFKKPRRVVRSRNTRRTSAGRKGNTITKPRKRRRVYYTGDDDEDEDEYVGDEEDEEFMSLGKKANRINKPREKKRASYTDVDDDEEFMPLGREVKQMKKPREKNRVSYTEEDDDDVDDDDDGDDDDDDEFGEFVSSDRNQRKKPQEKTRVSYAEEEEDDDAGFMSSGREGNQIKKPVEKNRVLYTKEDDDEEDDYADFVSLGRKRNQRQEPKDKKRASYTEEDDEEEDDDDAEFMSSGRESNQIKKKVLYTEEEDDDDEDIYLELMSAGRNRNQRKKRHDEKRVSYTEEHEDNDDAEFMTLGTDRNQVKKPREKNRVSYTEEDDDDDDDDYVEFMSSDRIQRKKPREKHKVSDTEEDEDNAEFMSSGREANQIKKPREKNMVSCTEEDDDDIGDDEKDYAEFVSTGRKRTQRKKPRKRVSDTEDDDAEFMYLDGEANQIKNPKEKKRVSYTEVDDDDEEEEVDDEEFFTLGREGKQIKKHKEKDMVAYTEKDDDDDNEVDGEDDAEDNQIKKHGEKKRVSYTKEDDDDDDDDDDDEDNAGFVSSGRKKPEKKRVSDTEEDADDDDDDDFMYPVRKVNQNLCEKRKVSYTEDDSELISTSKKSNPVNDPQEKGIVSSEEDNQEEEDENDAEFKLSESDFLDDEDETPKMKRNEKVTKSHPQKKSVRGRQKKSKKSKKPTRPKQRNHRYPRKVASSKEKKSKKSKIKKPTAESDSDFVSAPSSDHEYTISEEEREQMREARVYCANLRAKWRSSSCQNQEENPPLKQRKYPMRKGKEKLEDTKDEMGKQVCGICLSEEAKRTVRGVLNCCRHYFCFSCIMEWSKVESRCPLCKQRFSTITKSAKSDTGFDLRTVVIPVPECDQVYEPSEEELRGYLDPYESVICTECHHGGEDALMLLCDICDSSAHTFCVGLGREVPEGNWYCDGCRPTVFSSLNSSDLPSPAPGGFDLNELYVPETPLTQQQTRVLPEPGDFMPATTLRDRRRIHRQIHHRFLNNNRMNDFVSRNGRSSGSSSSSGIRLFGSQLDQARVSTPQREDHVLPSMDHLGCADVTLEGEHGGPGMDFDSRLGFGQLHPCTNRSSIGSDAGPSPYVCREVVGPSRTSQGGFHAPY